MPRARASWWCSVALNAEIARNLGTAASQVGKGFAIVSRSDSTLRGHFRAEVEALIGALDEPIDGVIVAPAFFEGGRTLRNKLQEYRAEGDLEDVETLRTEA